MAIFRYFLTFPKEVYSLCKLVKKANIDIVHCNSARQFKGVVVGWLSRKKVTWHLQDTWNPLIIRTFLFAASFMVNHFIAAGERVREYYLGQFPLSGKPVKIIQAPVDTSVFDPDLIQADQRIADTPGVRVVSVGNINRAKGYQHFVEAASYVNRKSWEVNFWIVGRAMESQRDYYESILKKIKRDNIKNLHFYGLSTDVKKALKAADIYVCSSIYEASPISVWEAMSMGKAIVATDVGDVSRFIMDGENGFVVPVGDSAAISEKISILIENPQMRQEFGRKARVVACQQLDLKVAVRRHLEVYRQCLSLKELEVY